MNLIQFQPAALWHCPKCASKNFAEMLPIESTPELIAKLAEHVGVSAKNQKFIALPKVVQCYYCRTKFPTDNEGDAV